MVKTINLNTEILPDRELRITLPADVPPGPAEILLVISTPVHTRAATLVDLANSDFIGIWRDRPDIDNTIQFPRTLRSEGWKHPG